MLTNFVSAHRSSAYHQPCAPHTRPLRPDYTRYVYAFFSAHFKIGIWIVFVLFWLEDNRVLLKLQVSIICSRLRATSVSHLLASTQPTKCSFLKVWQKNFPGLFVFLVFKKFKVWWLPCSHVCVFSCLLWQTPRWTAMSPWAPMTVESWSWTMTMMKRVSWTFWPRLILCKNASVRLFSIIVSWATNIFWVEECQVQHFSGGVSSWKHIVQHYWVT